jgi:hypothetical protein
VVGAVHEVGGEILQLRCVTAEDLQYPIREYPIKEYQIKEYPIKEYPIIVLE